MQQVIGPYEDLLTIVKRHITLVVWTCLPFIRSGQYNLARHTERGKKADRTRDGKTTSGNEHAWSLPSSGEQRKMQENGSEDICGAPTTPALEG